MLKIFFILTATMFCFSCKKDNNQEGKTVEIFLLKTFKTIAGKCQVDPSASSLQNEPAISNDDIVAYYKNDFQFELSGTAFNRVKDFNDFTPFAVTVDKQVVYYGILKKSISSASCDHSITMNTDFLSGNKIAMILGYPGPIEGVTIDDQRNNPKLVTTLQAQGKLR